MVLGIDDEFDGFLECFAAGGCLIGVDHTADFGEHEGGDAVAVHGPVAAFAPDEESVWLLLSEQPCDGALDFFGVGAFHGDVACGEEGHDGEGSGGGGFAEVIGGPGAGGLLFTGNPLEGAADGLVDFIVECGVVFVGVSEVLECGGGDELSED
ncbi:MAG: hypothetical protein RL215_1981 [Planctomycetota bacterium]